MRICDRCGRPIEEECDLDVGDIFVNIILKVLLGEKDLCCKCKKELLELIRDDIIQLKRKIKEFIEKKA